MVIAAGHVEGTDRFAAVFEDVAHTAAGAVLGDNGKNDILGRHPMSKLAVNVNGEGLRLLLHKALGRQDVADLAGTNAECERAESAMRAGVAVAADNRHARLRDAQFRPDHVNDALDVAFNVEERHVKVGAVLAESANLRGRIVGPVELHGPDTGGDGMIHGRKSPVRPPHRQAPFAKSGERLWRGDFMHQVGIDVEHGRRAFILRNHVRIPDFFEQRLSHATFPGLCWPAIQEVGLFTEGSFRPSGNGRTLSPRRGLR